MQATHKAGLSVTRIPVLKPKLPSVGQIYPILESMDVSRIYSNYGPILMQYRDEVAGYLKINPELIVIMSNATLAMQGLVSIMSPSVWNVPNYTFAATGLAVKQAGKRVLLHDIQLDSWQMNFPDPNFHDANQGYLPVMPFGASSGIEKWSRLPNVVVDAAASFGTAPIRFDDLNHSSAIVFSVHATKVLGAGEGGIVVCGSKEMAEELRSWSNFGFSSSRISNVLGTNAKMSEVCAAYGLASLNQREKEFEEWQVARERIKPLIDEFNLSNITTDYYGVNPYWIITLENEESCQALISSLESNQIDCRRWWPSLLNTMPVFSNDGSSHYPVGEKVLATTLGLPFFRDISADEVDRISLALSVLV